MLANYSVSFSAIGRNCLRSWIVEHDKSNIDQSAVFLRYEVNDARRRFSALLLAGLGLPWSTFAVSSCRAQTVSEQYLLAAANQDREAAGLKPLVRDLLLEQAALNHAREMASHGEISHQFSGEPDLASRAGATGSRFSLVTENVAEASNSPLIHELWMKSAGHRANLLDPAVDAVGIAVVSAHGQLYAVEDFTRSVRHLTPEQQEGAVASLLKSAGLPIVQSSADARQTCQMKTGFAGTRQPWFVMRYTTSSFGQLPQELLKRLGTGKYHEADLGACTNERSTPFTSYSLAVLLYP